MISILPAASCGWDYSRAARLRANYMLREGTPFRACHEHPCPPEAHSLLMVSSLISYVRTARLRAVRARRRHYILLLTLWLCLFSSHFSPPSHEPSVISLLFSFLFSQSFIYHHSTSIRARRRHTLFFLSSGHLFSYSNGALARRFERPCPPEALYLAFISLALFLLFSPLSWALWLAQPLIVCEYYIIYHVCSD